MVASSRICLWLERPRGSMIYIISRGKIQGARSQGTRSQGTRRIRIRRLENRRFARRGTNKRAKMHQLPKHDVPSQSGLLAPDTTGMNFYRADPALTDLLRIHLPDALFRHIEPHLDRLGALAGGPLDECPRLAA